MTRVIIVVQGSMVQEVLSASENIDVAVLDLDEHDINRLEEKERYYNELLNSKLYKNIL